MVRETASCYSGVEVRRTSEKVGVTVQFVAEEWGRERFGQRKPWGTVGTLIPCQGKRGYHLAMQSSRRL
jgi:hypothetical protein